MQEDRCLLSKSCRYISCQLTWIIETFLNSLLQAVIIAEAAVLYDKHSVDAATARTFKFVIWIALLERVHG